MTPGNIVSRWLMLIDAAGSASISDGEHSERAVGRRSRTRLSSCAARLASNPAERTHIRHIGRHLINGVDASVAVP